MLWFDSGYYSHIYVYIYVFISSNISLYRSSSKFFDFIPIYGKLMFSFSALNSGSKITLNSVKTYLVGSLIPTPLQCFTGVCWIFLYRLLDKKRLREQWKTNIWHEEVPLIGQVDLVHRVHASRISFKNSYSYLILSDENDVMVFQIFIFSTFYCHHSSHVTCA